MAASAWTAYTQAVLGTMQGSVNWASTTLKVALLTPTYAPAVNTDSTWASISTEATGTGYTAGGCAVTGATVSNTGSTVNAAGTIAGWATATVAARYAVLYDSATGRLLAYSDLTGGAGGTVSSTNGAFSLGSFTVGVTHTP
jgi:hypothetical protein